MKLNLTFRTRLPEMSVDRAEIVWGIRRQAGSGDMFDPASQAKSKAHAFAAGRDDMAVCGFRPLRFGRRRAMPLAAASEYNKQCTKCVARLPEVTRSSVVLLDELKERVAIPDAESLRIVRHAAPEPVLVAVPVVSRPEKRRLAKDLTAAA